MLDISLLLSLEPHISSGMSTFQMNNFVIEDHITPYRKLRQAIVEAKARLENITSIGFDLEEIELNKDLAIANRLHASSNNEIHVARMKDVAVRRFEFEINRKHALLDQMKSEADFFLNVINEIVNADFGGPEAILSLMKDKSFQGTQEANFWTKKLARGVYSDLINYGTVSKGLLESISCLPKAQQKEIVSGAMLAQMEFQELISVTKDALLISKD